jgi:hypothetical protein
MSSGITPDNIKHVADLVGNLKPVVEFSQSALGLHSRAQRLSADQITPNLIAFCNNFPDQARAVAERQDLQRISFRGTDHTIIQLFYASSTRNSLRVTTRMLE